MGWKDKLGGVINTIIQNPIPNAPTSILGGAKEGPSNQSVGAGTEEWIGNWNQSGIGRAPTQKEIEAINKASTTADRQYVAKVWGDTGLANRESVIQQGSALGVNYTTEEADALAQKYRNFSTAGLNSDLAYREIERSYTDSLNKAQEEKLDKALNPGKYATDEQKASNLATADNLVKTIYGSDYQDSEGLTQFLSDRLAGGESAYELSQFLKTTPQYTQTQADLEAQKASEEASAARSDLNTELVKTQQEVFNKAQPDIIASYMRAGRLNSSGLNSALAKAQKQLESERQGYLANAAYTTAQQQSGYNREDFVNSQNASFNQYLQNNQIAQQQKLNLQNVGNSLSYQQPYTDLSRYQSLADQSRQRQYELEDYSAQKNDFYEALSQQRKMQNQQALYGILGSAIGAAGSAYGRRG